MRKSDNSVTPEMNRIVSEILDEMDEINKANVKFKTEDQLNEFHSGWGQGIRNSYQLHRNKRLVEALGAEDADNASSMIIQECWRRLQSDENIQLVDTTINLTYVENEGYLEIGSEVEEFIRIEGIDLEFATKIGRILRAQVTPMEYFASWTVRSIDRRHATLKICRIEP